MYLYLILHSAPFKLTILFLLSHIVPLSYAALMAFSNQTSHYCMIFHNSGLFTLSHAFSKWRNAQYSLSYLYFLSEPLKNKNMVCTNTLLYYKLYYDSQVLLILLLATLFIFSHLWGHLHHVTSPFLLTILLETK